MYSFLYRLFVLSVYGISFDSTDFNFFYFLVNINDVEFDFKVYFFLETLLIVSFYFSAFETRELANLVGEYRRSKTYCLLTYLMSNFNIAIFCPLES